jgi:hypothetical protein
MKRFMKFLLLTLLIVPLTISAETVGWTPPVTFDDNTTVIPSSDLAQIEYFLYLVKEGNPTARTYIGKAAGGATTWGDNILVQANAWASGANAPYQAAIPGWIVLKVGDNVLVTIHASLNGSTSAASTPYRWTLPGAAPIPPLPPPTATLTAAPASIIKGTCTTLTWATQNATSVAIDQGIGTVSASGTKQVCPIANTTYSITAIGLGGTKVATVSVAVTVPPVVTPGCNPPTGITIRP